MGVRSRSQVQEGRNYRIAVLDEAGNVHTITGECVLEPDTFVIREDPLSLIGAGTSITARSLWNVPNDEDPYLMHAALIDAMQATKGRKRN